MKLQSRDSLILIYILLIFTAFLIFSFIILNFVFNFNGSTNAFIRNIYLIILVVIALLVIFTLILLYFFVYDPIHLIKNKIQDFIENDLKAISLAISEFSRGNLTNKINKSIYTDEKIRGMSEFYDFFKIVQNLYKETVYDINSITSEASKRLYYVGTDSFLDGKKIGEYAGEYFKGKGEVVILVKTLKQPSYYLRQKGFNVAVSEKYKGIKIVEIRELGDLSDESTYTQTVELIKKYPNLSAIYLTGASGFLGVAKAIEDTDSKGNVKLFSHDITDITVEYISKGIVAATFFQNPFAQGYIPLALIYNYLINRKEPIIKRYLLSLITITSENINQYWNKEKGSILSQSEIDKLLLPVENKENKNFKIGILLADSFFWQGVTEGAKYAEEKLKEFNADVRIYVPEEFTKGDWSCDAFIKAIEKLISEGVNGIVLPVLDYELIPYLNQKISEGIVISIVNAEPLSFRGMLDDVYNHASNLFNFSIDLASSTRENSQATEQINNTMSLIHTETENQIKSLSDTGNLIKTLEDNISDAIQKSNDSIVSSQKNIKSANEGYQAVQKNYDAIQSLKKSSDLTNSLINDLNNDTAKIVEIIEIIDDIAAQINVLAINAAIEASHTDKTVSGFGVVASEIRKLAKKSTKSTVDIQSLIDHISKSVDKATENIAESLGKVNKSFSIAKDAENALKDILESSKESETSISTISDILKQMGGLSENVKESMKDLRKVNENTTTGINEMTVSINEMNLEVSNLSKMAETLKNMSQSQVDLLSQFVISDNK